MNTPSSQKFIVSFLILAALTSSSAFFFSDNLNGNNRQSAADTGATATTLNGQKVFVEKVPLVPNYASPLAMNSDIRHGSGSNFTDYAADKLAAGVLAANPKGPTIKNGLPNLDLPKDLASITDISNLLPGSFSPEIDSKKISLLKDYTTEDVINYLENSRSVLEDNLAPGLNGLTKTSMGADSLPSITAIYDKTENKIYASKVPTPLKNFNSALLGFVNSQRVFFNQDDPIKALIAIRNPQLALGKFQQALQNEVKNVKNNLPQILASAKDSHTNFAFAALGSILAIEKAYAFSDFIGGVSQILSTIVEWVSTAWDYAMNLLSGLEWLQKLLTEIVKDQIIKKLIAQIINWVNGGGEPQFVSNWQGFLGDAVNTAAGGVISKFAPQLCNNFGPLIKVSLMPQQNVNDSASNNPYACTLDKVVSNIDQFKDSFQNGGWLAYGELLKPQNNIFGSMIQLNDAVTIEGAKAKEAAHSDANSSNGFKSPTECVNEIIYYDGDSEIEGISNEADARSDFGSNFVSATCPGNGDQCSQITVCDPDSDSKNSTTPGGTVAKATDQISSSPVDRIVNAADLTGLVTAIANMALSKLMTSAKSGMTNLTTAELNKPSNSDANCDGLSEPDLSACKKLNDEIGGTEGSAGSGKEGIVSQLQSLFKLKQKILSEGTRVITKAEVAIGYLGIASTTCSGVLASSTTIDAQDTLSFIEQSASDLSSRINDSGGVKDIINDIASTTTPGGLQKLGAVIELAKSDKIADVEKLAKMFDITLSSSASESEKKNVFYNKFSSDINSSGSTFGKIFGSLNDVGNTLGDIKTFATTVTLNGGCGILEKAKLLYTPAEDTDACSIKVVEKTCRSGDF